MSCNKSLLKILYENSNVVVDEVGKFRKDYDVWRSIVSLYLPLRGHREI